MKEVLRDTLRDVKHFEATSADTVDINGVTRSCRNHINYLHRHLSQGLWDARRQYVHRRRVPTSHPGHPPQRLLRTIPNPARRRGHLKSTASGTYILPFPVRRDTSTSAFCSPPPDPQSTQLSLGRCLCSTHYGTKTAHRQTGHCLRPSPF